MKRYAALEPSHPGKLLNEIAIPGTGRTTVEIASRLGISRQTLYDILPERAAVTPETAVRLDTLVGNGVRPDISFKTTPCRIQDLPRP